jgi:hypothetical protein
MVWAALLIFIRLLPAPAAWGEHCPTARVQVIQTQEGLRAPAPGDAEFEQCQCAQKQAEKKLSEEGSDVRLLTVPPFLDCPSPPLFTLSVALPAAAEFALVAPRLTGVSSSPASPPPRLS